MHQPDPDATEMAAAIRLGTHQRARTSAHPGKQNAAVERGTRSPDCAPRGPRGVGGWQSSLPVHPR